MDNEDESLSELDAVEQKKQLPEVAPLSEMPEKYRQKSLEEVVNGAVFETSSDDMVLV